MDIRIAGFENDSIVDGPGFRLAVFTQGCPHHCPGCHNPETHDFAAGTVVDTEKIIAQMLDNPLLDGLTLSGGEPFCQPGPCTVLAKAAHEANLNVWAYSGFTFEQLQTKPEVQELLREVDVLVDGRFELSLRTLDLRFRGSKNQRLIDVKKSLEEGKAVEYPLV